MQKLKKKLIGFLLVVSMVTGSFLTPVLAASSSATLNSTDTTVTTTYSDCRSSTIVYVYGYEKHPTTGHVAYYDKSKSTTSTGNVTFTHNADSGYKFQLSYQGTPLKSKIVVGGAIVADITVTH